MAPQGKIFLSSFEFVSMGKRESQVAHQHVRIPGLTSESPLCFWESPIKRSYIISERRNNLNTQRLRIVPSLA